MSTAPDIQAIAYDAVGYAVTNTARTAFTKGPQGQVIVDGQGASSNLSRAKFEVRSLISGGAAAASWQYFGKNLAASYITKPEGGVSVGNEKLIARALWFAVVGMIADNAQGGKTNFVGALIDGVGATVIGDQVGAMMK